jgi:hypothetical protein
MIHENQLIHFDAKWWSIRKISYMSKTVTLYSKDRMTMIPLYYLTDLDAAKSLNIKIMPYIEKIS